MPAGYGTRTPTQTAWLAGAAGLVGLLLVGGAWLVWQGVDAAPAPRLDASGRADPPLALILQ